MPQTAYQHPVSSNPTTQFLEFLQTNDASVNTDLVLPSKDPLWFIRAITLVATQNLTYELALFSRADNLNGTLDTDYFIGNWQFTVMNGSVPASPGYPVTIPSASPGDSFYHFYIDGNFVPYYDLDQLDSSFNAGTYPQNAKLHCRLINRSATPKAAGEAGALKITFFVAAQGQQA